MPSGEDKNLKEQSLYIRVRMYVHTYTHKF